MLTNAALRFRYNDFIIHLCFFFFSYPASLQLLFSTSFFFFVSSVFSTISVYILTSYRLIGKIASRGKETRGDDLFLDDRRIRFATKSSSRLPSFSTLLNTEQVYDSKRLSVRVNVIPRRLCAFFFISFPLIRP